MSAGGCNPIEVTPGECHLLYFLHRPSIRGIAPHFILSVSVLQVPAIMFLMIEYQRFTVHLPHIDPGPPVVHRIA